MRGKRKHRLFARKIAGDHPRGCGENLYHNFRVFCRAGSPPRMRGKPSGRRSRSRKIRITPADAGKTMPPLQGESGTRDHPRGCGENDASCASKRSTMGSPPRMRGKPAAGTEPAWQDGITPAGAGKTEQVVRCKDCLQDHPRRCGENPAGVYDDNCADRITPAGAGKTARLYQLRDST